MTNSPVQYTAPDQIPEELWQPKQASEAEAEAVIGTSRSLGVEVTRQFLRRPTVLVSLVTIVLLFAFAFIGPSFTGYSVSKQNLEHTNLSPRLNTTRLAFPDGSQQNFLVTNDLKILPVSDDGKVGTPLERLDDDAAEKIMTFAWHTPSGGEQELRLDYSRAPSALLSESGQRLAQDNVLWNRSNLLGTDALGRDMTTRLMFGTQISLIVGVLAAIINLTIGVIYGLIAGFFGGRVDAVMMRLVDIIDTIPLTLYVILLLVLLNSGLMSIVIALSSVYWVAMARIVRGQVHSIKQQEFVVAARTIGSSVPYILRRHLLPNAMGSILVTATMLIPQAIFIEAFLSFIGLGVASPMASLGTMSNDAVETLRTAPYQLMLPAVVICIAMFAFTFVGDGLREALDPKLRRRRS